MGFVLNLALIRFSSPLSKCSGNIPIIHVSKALKYACLYLTFTVYVSKASTLLTNLKLELYGDTIFGDIRVS